MAENPSENNDIQLSAIHSPCVSPTKTVNGVTADGRPIAVKAPKPSEGTISRLRFPREDWGNSFAHWLDNVPPGNVLVPGHLIPPGDVHPFTTKDRVVPGQAGVARTKENFAPSEIVGADFDFGDMPRALRDMVERERLLPLLARVAPAFSGVGSVSRASTSAYIHDKRTGGRTGFRGAHLFFRVVDPGDWPRAANALDQRLKLAGFAFTRIAINGRVVVKSPLDVTASTRPFGLFYVADAIFPNPEVGYEEGKRKAHVRNGAPLDTSTIVGLSADETDELAKIEAKLRDSVAGEADRIRDAYFKARGFSPEEIGEIGARARKSSSAYVDDVLTGEHQVLFDDGRVVSVMDILLDPEAYNGAKCTDPIEWGEKNKAVIYSDQRRPLIHANGHSGINFYLCPTVEEVIRAATGVV